MPFEQCSQEEARIFQREGRCPDCRQEILAAGPSGGMSVNYYCLNPDCGSRFNDMFVFGVERISEKQPLRDRDRNGVPVAQETPAPDKRALRDIGAKLRKWAKRVGIGGGA